MDYRGPRLRQLTKLAQLDKQRFVLEWAPPLEPGLATHVTLFNRTCVTPQAIAASEGPDEADILLELWTILTDDQPYSTEAIDYVAEAYAKRTGRPPSRER